MNVSIPTFEALTQFGTAKITVQNIGTLEASYSLTVSVSDVHYYLSNYDLISHFTPKMAPILQKS